MIEANGLTKRYGNTLAVDELSFVVRPGLVTGFLGPNGAGKSTTMRMILGLDRSTSGLATVNGKRYADLHAPLQEVGALLDADATHEGRTAYNHLLFVARSNRLGRGRVKQVLGMVGLDTVAGRRVRGFSLGMRQRLGIAAALLGDPGILILDEPMNGLDTQGIRWIRRLMQDLAAQGRTIFVSSHLMGEMELAADHLIVIGRGRLVADTSMQNFIGAHSERYTLVRSPQGERLKSLLEINGATVTQLPTGAWQVRGPSAAAIGELATEHNIGLHELTPRLSSLEEVYSQLTETSVVYRDDRESDARKALNS
jgi:ABC-2 type transport system ATP-binding protein